MTHRKRILQPLALVVLTLALCRGVSAAPASEISVDLKLDATDYLVGEKIRAVVDIRNMASDKVSVGFSNSKDRFFVEIYRSSDMYQLDRKDPNKPFVKSFRIDMNEGLKMETFLGSHYGLSEPRRYLARPVLVHGGMRYEGQYRAFDIVPGMEVSSAVQVFSNAPGLNREFKLKKWTRDRREHLFLTAEDSGTSERRWRTFDLGEMMRITSPTISVMPSGEVIVIHRMGPDHFLRSEFWSLPGALEFHSRELVQDPETAGQNRVQEMHKVRGGVKPKARPWWKFW